jgi:hypothetical protein
MRGDYKRGVLVEFTTAEAEALYSGERHTLPAISAYQRLGKAIRVETNETPAELDRRLGLDEGDEAA